MPVPKVLICTLGPSSLNERVIPQLEAAGVTSFRINMSHTEIGDLEGRIHFIQKCTQVPVCLDTEGAQIRTGLMHDGTTVSEGTSVRLVGEAIRGDATTIPLTPGFVADQVGPATWVSVDFDSVLLRVDRVRDGAAEATVISGGEIGSHKAVTAFPSPPLPAFSKKDLLAIQVAVRNHLHEYALSFCDRAETVAKLREMVGPRSTIIAKIESREGVRNLEEIARTADSLLIDRGDLSRAVRLEAIPLL